MSFQSDLERMTSLKRHRFIPIILLGVFLLFVSNVDAQRSRRNRNRMNDTIQVDVVSADTLLIDSLVKKDQPLTSPVTYKAKDSIEITEDFTFYRDFP